MSNADSSYTRDSQKLTDQRLVQLGRLTDGVKAEFDLITARIGWFMTSQAFVTAAFVVTLANSVSIQDQYPLTFLLLKLSLPTIGIYASYVVGVAVGAAHKAATRLKDERDSLIAQLPSGLRIQLISSTDRIHHSGNLPAKVLPSVVGAFWLLVLLSLLPWPAPPYLTQ